jgi:hypothetical protein
VAASNGTSSKSEGAVSPMQLAKELGVRPQILYGLIRKGRIQDVGRLDGDPSKTYVYRSDVLRVLGALRHRRPKGEVTGSSSDDGTTLASPLQKGQAASWISYGSGEKGGVRVFRQVVSVIGSDEYFTNFQSFKSDYQMTFRNTTVQKMLESGMMRIEEPQVVVGIAIAAYETNGQTELADSLRQWLSASSVAPTEVGAAV